MMKERKQFTKEFKEGAVRLVTEQGRTIGDAAQSLGISPWTMSRWVKAARAEGSDAFRGQGQRTPQEQELFELRQKVRQLEEERAILKKAAAYFARHVE
jgi:transposase